MCSSIVEFSHYHHSNHRNGSKHSDCGPTYKQTILFQCLDTLRRAAAERSHIKPTKRLSYACCLFKELTSVVFFPD